MFIISTRNDTAKLEAHLGYVSIQLTKLLTKLMYRAKLKFHLH